jgi:hypothetical protein
MNAGQCCTSLFLTHLPFLSFLPSLHPSLPLSLSFPIAQEDPEAAAKKRTKTQKRRDKKRKAKATKVRCEERISPYPQRISPILWKRLHFRQLV